MTYLEKLTIMPKKKKGLVKNIEMIDYELKARNKFPADELYPVSEQAKQDGQESEKKKCKISKTEKKL